MEQENGVRRVVWVPLELDAIIEQTRRKLGLNRSAFYKYCITQLLQQLNVLTSSVHAPEAVAKNG